jgi:hypothetical protein
MRNRPPPAWIIGALAVGISTTSTAQADPDSVTTALDTLFDAYVADTVTDQQIAERLQAARPTLVRPLRVLGERRLIPAVDSALASYGTMVDPRGTGSQPPARGLVSGLADNLAAVVRWGDLATARAAAPAATVVGALDLVILRRRHRQEVAAGITPRPADADVAVMLARRTNELLQLNYDLVGVEGLETDRVESTRAGKKLARFEGDPAVAIARQALRRMVALGHTRVTDPRRGPGRIVSVP